MNGGMTMDSPDSETPGEGCIAGGCLGTPQPAGAVKGRDQERQVREAMPRCRLAGAARSHGQGRATNPPHPTCSRHISDLIPWRSG